MKNPPMQRRDKKKLRDSEMTAYTYRAYISPGKLNTLATYPKTDDLV